MPNTFMNPVELSKPNGYTHVVSTTGTRTIYVSGQVALDKEGKLVGEGDLRAQAVQIVENLKMALADAGARLEDVVKMTTYVVNYKEEYRTVLREIREGHFSYERPPAHTLVGVQALALRGFLLEMEAIAVVDEEEEGD